ncbi:MULTISPECIES: pyridoxine/pyridoxamine 5'-phosphate oxidase [unclassified Leifsonia]|uniref:pyridoxine/pyridoxamine 5'-phosphate oxidase n=1 Tax=unclassified Leifsonia TaxID=2663824 RepID=UPI0006FCF3B2|nr:MULTISPECIES: pyridoxamine 5'-phosphate oxidase family protein [unclassified Leifsonia]KQX08475.1 pyridoxamine 5'-phosphate oxidase [Leifsonia sp. Root1293]KRA12760.1 pyridoxamine 5'-phosphate oxidase [Leifsonia sp. Root60]
MSESVRRMLRALPDFPDELPEFDPETAPSDPVELFIDWLEAAVVRGIRQPHAFSLATTDASGRVSSRMLILKDIDDGGWCFATSRLSRKGRELVENRAVALNFFWAELGRQVRVTGDAVELSAEVSAADWAARPSADGAPNPTWQVYSVRPREIEFWQARHDRNHIRHRYDF